jgi:hypothetical protein
MAYIKIGQAIHLFRLGLRLNRVGYQSLRGNTVKSLKSLANERLAEHEEFIRGQSDFKNLKISWIFSEAYGLTIAHIHCGLCSVPLESVALRVGEQVFLLCEEGHLVGNDIESAKAKAEWNALRERYRKDIELRKRQLVVEHEKLLLDVQAGRKTESELHEWECSVPSFETLPRFTKRHEYNQKLEELMREFKEIQLQRLLQK